MWVRVMVLTVVCAVIPCSSTAQTVELVYTPAVLQDAVALKGSLKVPLLHAFSAMSLVGASAEKKQAYGDNLSGATAVVIIGEDALKAVADVEFAAPVILVNAAGRTEAKGRVFRVFDKTPPPSAAAVASSAAVTALMAGAGEVVLKGEAGATVQAVLGALK